MSAPGKFLQLVLSALATDWVVYVGLCLCLGLSVGLRRFLSKCSRRWEARLKAHKGRIVSLEGESEACRAQQRELLTQHRTYQKRESDIKRGNTGTVLNGDLEPPPPPNHRLSLRLRNPAQITLKFMVEWHFMDVGNQDFRSHRVELCDKSDPDQGRPLATVTLSSAMQPMTTFKAITVVVSPQMEFEARLVRRKSDWQGREVKERSTNSVRVQGSVTELSPEELRREEHNRHLEEPSQAPHQGSGSEVPEGSFTLWCESAQMKAEGVGEGSMGEEGMDTSSLHLLDERYHQLAKVPLKGVKTEEGRPRPPAGQVGFSGQFPPVLLEVKGWGEKNAMVAVFRNYELLQQGPLRLQLSVRTHEEL